MIAPKEARSIVLEEARPLPGTTVPGIEAVGLRLAEPVVADRPLPPADRSAMDGFALQAADVAITPATLSVIGEVAAGSPARPEIASGTCAAIFTGGNVPPGADTVVMVEDCDVLPGEKVLVRRRPRKGQHILRRGEDAAEGALVLPKGRRIGPTQLGLLATVGCDPVPVVRRAEVGVLCTGRELKPARESVEPHEIRNSNGPALLGALGQLGTTNPRDLGIAPDELDELRQCIRKALSQVDVLLLTGGASVGNYDLVGEAVEAEGCQKLFHGVSQKPGKPALFAKGPQGQLVFGLPGNPLSAFTTFHCLVRPALDILAGGNGNDPPVWRVRLSEALQGRTTRTRFAPAWLLQPNSEGVLFAEPVQDRSSADVVAGGKTQGVVIVPPASILPAGSVADFMYWDMTR